MESSKNGVLHEPFPCNLTIIEQLGEYGLALQKKEPDRLLNVFTPTAIIQEKIVELPVEILREKLPVRLIQKNKKKNKATVSTFRMDNVGEKYLRSQQFSDAEPILPYITKYIQERQQIQFSLFIWGTGLQDITRMEDNTVRIRWLIKYYDEKMQRHFHLHQIGYLKFEGEHIASMKTEGVLFRIPLSAKK